MNPLTLIDGELQQCVSVADRGFQYGDGLFETIALQGGRLEFWQRHMARLALGCERLAIPMPDPALLLDDARRICEQRSSGVLKIIVTRGEGGRGYRPPEAPQVRRIASLHPWPDYPESYRCEGVCVRLCETRLGDNVRLAGIKHLNRLEQVLARAEWSDTAVFEGLMLDQAGDVVEGTMSNLFFVRDGVLHTPDLSKCGVAGIMREMVIESAARASLRCCQGRYAPAEFEAADELFISNAVIGIWPVRELAGRKFLPGPVFETLAELVTEVRNSESISCNLSER